MGEVWLRPKRSHDHPTQAPLFYLSHQPPAPVKQQMGYSSSQPHFPLLSPLFILDLPQPLLPATKRAWGNVALHSCTFLKGHCTSYGGKHLHICLHQVWQSKQHYSLCHTLARAHYCSPHFQQATISKLGQYIRALLGMESNEPWHGAFFNILYALYALLKKHI